MRNFNFLTFIVAVTIFSACDIDEKNNSTNIELEAKALLDNENFNTYADNLFLFSNHINENFDKNEIKALSLQIEAIKNTKLNIDEQYNEITHLTKFKSKKDLVTIFEKIAYSSKNLYTTGNGRTLKKEVFERALILKLEKKFNNTYIVETRAGGNWRYLLCCAAAAVEGAAILAACEAASLGIPNPLCVAAASVWAANAIAECADEHLPPSNPLTDKILIDEK
jgi:hypothetical protein